MRNPGKGRLLTFEPSSGNWRKNLGTDIRNGSVKRYPIIGIPFGLRPHSIPIMGNDTVNGILPYPFPDYHCQGYGSFYSIVGSHNGSLCPLDFGVTLRSLLYPATS